jgi:hypothetical protein
MGRSGQAPHTRGEIYDVPVPITDGPEPTPQRCRFDPETGRVRPFIPEKYDNE